MSGVNVDDLGGGEMGYWYRGSRYIGFGRCTCYERLGCAVKEYLDHAMRARAPSDGWMDGWSRAL